MPGSQREGNAKATMETITSRPMLLAAVRGATHSGGQTTLNLTPLHGKKKLLKVMIANIHGALQHVRAAAKQFKAVDRWAVLLCYVSDRVAPSLPPFKPPPWLPVTG